MILVPSNNALMHLEQSFQVHQRVAPLTTYFDRQESSTLSAQSSCETLDSCSLSRTSSNVSSTYSQSLSWPPSPVGSFYGHFGDFALEDLPDDALLAVAACLSPQQRRAMAAASGHLLSLCQDSFTSLNVPLPGFAIMAEAQVFAEQLQTGVASLPGKRFNSIKSVTVTLNTPPAAQPPVWTLLRTRQQLPSCKDDSSVDCDDACYPLNSWLKAYLATGCSRTQLQIFNVRQEVGAVLTQVGGSTLKMLLPEQCPNLQELSLPLLAPSAAPVLATLTQLRTLSFTVKDGSMIDAALSLPHLTELSVSTHKDLLYVVLQQQQVAALAKMADLQKLRLHNVNISDCNSAFQPLAALSKLTELQCSFPISCERLRYLPHLKVLQLPFFSGPWERMGCVLKGLTELRFRQALQEHELCALSELPELRVLQCDNIIISAASAAVEGYVGDGLVLHSVKTLRITGIFQQSPLLGALFPNLESLHVASLAPSTLDPTVPMAPFPHLACLTWPAAKALPQLLGACPVLTVLHLHGICSQQRLQELMNVTSWPVGIKSMTLAFNSSLQGFKPKHVQALLAAAPPSLQQLDELCLRDEASSKKAANEPGRIVDDAVVVATLKCLRGLRKLRLEGCGSITCNGLLSAVAAASLHLNYVEVAGCPKVRRNRAERIAAELGRPWLRVDWMSGPKA